MTICKHYLAALKILLIIGCMAIGESVSAQKKSICTTYPDIKDNFSEAKDNYHEYGTSDPCSICQVSKSEWCTKENVFKLMISAMNFVAPVDSRDPVKNCQKVLISLAYIKNTNKYCNGLGTVATGADNFNSSVKDYFKSIINDITQNTSKKLSNNELGLLAAQWVNNWTDDILASYMVQKISDEPILTVMDEKNYSVVNFTLPGHFLHSGKVTRTVVQKGDYIKIVTHGIGNNENRIKSWLNGLNWLADCVWNTVDERLRDAAALKINAYAASHKGNTSPAGFLSVYNVNVPAILTAPLDTKIKVDADDYVFIEAGGEIVIGETAGKVNASGTPARLLTLYNKYRNIQHGALVYKIKGTIEKGCTDLFEEEETSQYSSMVAEGKKGAGGKLSGAYFLAPLSGHLILDINDRKVSDNAGSFNVNVFVIKKEANLQRASLSMPLGTYYAQKNGLQQYHHLILDVLPIDLYSVLNSSNGL